MVKIERFEVEQWMDAHEKTHGVLNIAETCAASLSIADLAGLAVPTVVNGTTLVPPADPLSALATTKLTYGAIRGSATLRTQVAALFDVGKDAGVPPLPSDNVVITQGAIAANYLLFYTLLGPGDHAICVYPTYQQLYDVPRSLGAEVSLWKLKADKNYVPDTEELDGLVRPNTKMIIINNPNNPMGVPILRPVLEAIVSFARSRDLLIVSDEVYLPLYHGGALAGGPADDSTDDARPPPPPSPSILTLGYDKTIATGSMSKAFALAGLRLGWVASRDRAIVEAIVTARDYTTISVSQLDDGIARYALSDAVRHSLLRRNMELARRNIRHLTRFVDKWRSKGRVRCSWVPPTAGTTAFIQFATLASSSGDGGDDSAAATPVDDEKFCLDVLAATQVLMVPGARCFGRGEDFQGYVRIGYVNETAVLVEGLSKLDRYLENNVA